MCAKIIQSIQINKFVQLSELSNIILAGYIVFLNNHVSCKTKMF